MKICFLLNGFSDHGGIGRVVSILLNDLCSGGDFEMHALSYFHSDKPDIFKIDNKVKQEYLYQRPLSMKKAILTGGIKKLKNYLISNGIDVLVACGALYYPISILACRKTRTKCVCWEHSNQFTGDDYIFQKTCRAFGASHSDAIVVLTKSDQKQFENAYPAANIKQIYNPIDQRLIERNRGYDSLSKKIISVGRLVPPKNYGVLIEVAKEVLNKHDDWSWDIYGEGSLREELQGKINRLGLNEKLTLKGQSDHLYDLYRQYAFLVMTSTREGFPMALLEAAANSLPLISFDVATGPGEIIRNGIGGYLIDPFDTGRMISSIEMLISDTQLRIAIAENSRKICELFSQECVLAEWRILFDSIA